MTEHTQHTAAAALGLTDAELSAFLESARRGGKGPTLPRIEAPSLTGAFLACLVDGTGSVPVSLRKYEPDAFARAVAELAIHGFVLEPRGNALILTAPAGEPGSLTHLRQLVDEDAGGMIYRDRLARELHALQDRLEHYAFRDELEAATEVRAARRQRLEERKNTATTDGEHAHG